MRSWTDNELQEAVKSSKTYADIIRKLNLAVRPGNYTTVKKHIRRLDLDISHLLSKSGGNGGIRHTPLNEILIKNSTYNRWHLKNRLIKEELLELKCQVCGLGFEWNDKPLVLILDHINGVSDDNRFENLRLLCPNCNSQTKTFCRGSKALWPSG